MQAATEARASLIAEAYKQHRKLKVLVIGQPGQGKATLINKLLEDEVVTEGYTKCVSEVQTLSKVINDLPIQVALIPSNLSLNEEIRSKVPFDFQIVLYCTKMTNAHLRDEDKCAIINLKKAYGGLFILTFANEENLSRKDDRDREENEQEPDGLDDEQWERLERQRFQGRLKIWESDIHKSLKQVGIDREIVTKVPVIPIGDTRPSRENKSYFCLPNRKNWFSHFWETCHKRMNNKIEFNHCTSRDEGYDEGYDDNIEQEEFNANNGNASTCEGDTIESTEDDDRCEMGQLSSQDEDVEEESEITKDIRARFKAALNYFKNIESQMSQSDKDSICCRLRPLWQFGTTSKHTYQQGKESWRGNKDNSSTDPHLVVTPSQSTDIIEATGFVYYMEDGIMFTAATKENEFELIQYMKREHPEAVRRASVCINFEDNTEDIELKFDASQINGWSVNPSVQPCRLRCCDIKNFDKGHDSVPPYCWITVDRLPEAKEALHYPVRLVNVAESKPPTIFIHIAPKSHPPSANNLSTTRLLTGRASIDVETARQKLKQVLTTHHAKLCEAFRNSLGSIANELLQVGIITHEVHRSMDYNSMIGSFESAMNFIDIESELQEHCVKFLKALSNVGGPVLLAACKIQTEWTKAVGTQFNFSF